jgi:EAL and modified HD-GYP domain-containing signal transduction protein
MHNIFIGRQPIIDLNGNIHGYELLFRQSFDNYASPISCNTQATCRVLVNALNNFGSRKLLGKHYGFINIDHTFFNTPLFNAIPSDKFVLEILENTLVDDSFVSKVKSLKDQGYSFALDDMDLSEEMIERFEPLLEYLSYVKIDLFSASKEKIFEKINLFEPYNNIKLLAEKVETLEDYEYYKKLGFTYFQGYFYEKPTVFTQKKFDPSHRVLLEVIALIDANADIKELEEKLLNCPHLIMNLLKYINSVEIGVRESISSLRHAMALLGRQSLKQWILLFLYADATGPMFAEPILLSALFRAKMMSYLATCTVSSMQDEAFLTGLISLFDVMFGSPMNEVLAGVNLDESILSALIDKEGRLGDMLTLVISIEEENFFNIQEKMTKLGIDEDKLNAMATESYNWSNDFYEEHFAE